MQPHSEFEPFRPIEAVVRAISTIEGGSGEILVRWDDGLAMPFVPEDERTKPIQFYVQPSHIPATESRPTLAASETAVTEAFLSSLYDYSEAKAIGKGSLLVVRHFDALLKEGNFRQIDLAMVKADVNRLDPEIGFAFLTITAPARQKLDGLARRFFINRLRLRFLDRRPREYVDDLLRHYE
jgi:hypothetical protein